MAQIFYASSPEEAYREPKTPPQEAKRDEKS